jgi:hypothetical protein
VKIFSKRNEPSLAFALTHDKQVFVKVDITQLQADGFTESQSRTVQDEQEGADREPSEGRPPNSRGSLQKRLNLGWREDVRKELRLRRLRRPAARGNKGSGIAPATKEAELPNDSQLAGNGHWLASLAPGQPALEQSFQGNRVAGRGAHEKTLAELKSQVAFAAIPTNDRYANAAWQLLSALTLNLIRSFQIATGAARVP